MRLKFGKYFVVLFSMLFVVSLSGYFVPSVGATAIVDRWCIDSYEWPSGYSGACAVSAGSVWSVQLVANTSTVTEWTVHVENSTHTAMQIKVYPTYISVWFAGSLFDGDTDNVERIFSHDYVSGDNYTVQYWGVLGVQVLVNNVELAYLSVGSQTDDFVSYGASFYCDGYSNLGDSVRLLISDTLVTGIDGYCTVTFDSTCWTNGDTFFGVNELGEINNNAMKIPVNSSSYIISVPNGTELWLYGVADAGYYFAGGAVDFTSAEDVEIGDSGEAVTIVDDCSVTLVFSEWTEEFDNECFVAFSVDNSYTTLNVLFNGDVYTLNSALLFYNFSVPYNTMVTCGYWNTYYTFNQWNFEVIFISEGSGSSYSDDSTDNPYMFSVGYTDVNNRDLSWNLYPISVYNGVATPSPVPSVSATVDPEDIVTPFFTTAVPILVPLCLFFIPAVLAVVAVSKGTGGNVNPLLPFFGGGTAGLVLGFVAWSAMVPLYAVVAVILIDVAVVYSATRGGG